MPQIGSGYERFLCGTLLALLLAAPAFAQPSRLDSSKMETGLRDEPEKKSPVQSAEKKSAPLTLDALKLPARAVLVLYDEAKDALQLLPRLIVMTPEEFQRMQDQLEQLRRQSRLDKPESPSVCKLSGRVVDDLVHLEAHFEFQTDAPRTTVRLGCQKAWPTSALIDGKTPWLRQTDEGLAVVVDSPGKHVVDLKLLLPVASRRGPRGPERSLDLDLPRAAITEIVRFELPRGATEPRLGTRLLKFRRQQDQSETLVNVLAGPGPVDRLDLSWQPPRNAGAAAIAPVLAATERIIVRVHDTEVVTEAEITLRVLRGEMTRWQLRVPAPGATSAELKSISQDEDRQMAIEKKIDGAELVWDVSLKEPVGDAVRLNLQIRQPRPKTQLGIGPIRVVGAMTQRGEIEVRAAEDLRLFLQESPGLNRRDLTEEQRRDMVRASYAFGSLAEPNPSVPLIFIQMQEIKGVVEARTSQTLRLRENEKSKSFGWQVATRVEATPLRTSVDRLELTLPSGYQYDSSIGPVPADLVEEVVPDAARGRLVIKLAQKQSKPFSFTIAGSYSLPDPQAHTANLEFPCPVSWGDERSRDGAGTGVLDRGGQLTVSIPESFELFEPATGRSIQRSNKGLPTFSSLFASMPAHPSALGVREYDWNFDRMSRNIDLNWRPFRPEMPVDVVADVFLSAGRARIHERLQFQFLQPPPPQVPMRVGRGLVLDQVDGGRFVGETDADGQRDLILQTPVGKVHTLTFDYVVPLPLPAQGSSSQVNLPLIQAQAATRGRTRVRIWSDAGLLVSPASKDWTVGPTEIVPDRESLPTLVLNGALLDSVTLNSQLSTSRAAAVLVDRILIRASVADDGVRYRNRFVLRRLADHHLDIEFPVLLGRDRAAVTLGGKRLPLIFLDSSGREAEIGKRARLAVEPELYRQPVILDVTFQIESARLDEFSDWKLTLRPALLPSAVLLGRVRWQVDFPGDLLPLIARDGFTREQGWGWRGWLWGPRPSATAADLDQWLQEGLATPAPDTTDPSLVCGKSSLTDLRLILVPARFWLLVCSLSLLLFVSLFLYMPMPQFLHGLLLALAAIFVATTGLLWPSLLGLAVFGCEPALLVLCLLLIVRLRLHHRYRQQMVFMPGFQQLKNGSSLNRKDGSKVRRDLPTIEAQPAKSAPAGLESQS